MTDSNPLPSYTDASLYRTPAKHSYPIRLPLNRTDRIEKILKIVTLTLALACALGFSIAAGILAMPIFSAVVVITLAIAAVSLYSLLKKPKLYEILPQIEPESEQSSLSPSPQPPEQQDLPLQIDPLPDPESLPEVSLADLTTPPEELTAITVTPGYEALLEQNWDLLPSLAALDPSFTTETPQQPCFIWKLKDSKLIFISTSGDIAVPRIKTQGRVMIVNAANENISREGGGTNKALSLATSLQCWNASRLPRAHSRSGSQLQPGECRSAKWENSDHTSNDHVPGKAHFLAQLLGPEAAKCNNDPKQAFEVSKKAFHNLFQEAEIIGVDVIQLPLIGCNLFAPSRLLNLGKTRAEWIEAIKLALITSLQDFGWEQDNQEEQKIIILTDKDQPPIIPPRFDLTTP
uniref:Macro domain-containing protein n=1 Tax=Chlamydia pneumoniae TaxID=83558 RepID=A0A0F7WSI4_CHLPN|nr:Uncharacterized protein BN1224_DC9_BQ_00050 [Chlamydia pneumoniae]